MANAPRCQDEYQQKNLKIINIGIATTEGISSVFIYEPYFYIIQDTRNGMYYAGAKWARDATPHNFLCEGGYTTSSSIINEIIKENGIDVFIIKRTKKFKTAIEAYKYETLFLRRIDAKNNPNFYNKHNNDHLFTFHDERYKEKMNEIYGVSHPLKSSIILEKIRTTNIKKYGAPNVFCFESSVRKTIAENVFNKYGVSNISQLSETQMKISSTSIEKRGVDHHLKDPKVIARRLKTISNFSENKLAEIKEKSKNTRKERYGNPNFNNIEKIKQTNIEKYGVENVSMVPQIQEKMSIGISKTKGDPQWKKTKGLEAKRKLSDTLNSEAWKETKGKLKSEKLRKAMKNREKIECQHCGKTIDISNHTRWHGNNCKKYQDSV